MVDATRLLLTGAISRVLLKIISVRSDGAIRTDWCTDNYSRSLRGTGLALTSEGLPIAARYCITVTRPQCYCIKAAPVCTEDVNVIRLVIDSINVGRDGRANIAPLESGCLALQVQGPG